MPRDAQQEQISDDESEHEEQVGEEGEPTGEEDAASECETASASASEVDSLDSASDSDEREDARARDCDTMKRRYFGSLHRKWVNASWSAYASAPMAARPKRPGPPSGTMWKRVNASEISEMPTPDSGLEWGADPVERFEELCADDHKGVRALCHSLASGEESVRFTLDEWAKFGIEDLKWCHVIRTREGAIYRPAGTRRTHQPISRRACELFVSLAAKDLDATIESTSLKFGKEVPKSHTYCPLQMRLNRGAQMALNAAASAYAQQAAVFASSQRRRIHKKKRVSEQIMQTAFRLIGINQCNGIFPTSIACNSTTLAHTVLPRASRARSKD